MGASESIENDNALTFRASKIAKSLYPTIISLHLDPNQLPISGIILVGTQYVENCAEKGSKIFSSYESSTKIISSCMSYCEKFQTTTIILACEDNTIVLLGARFLTFLQKFPIHFHFSDITINISDVQITCEQQSFFQEFLIDKIQSSNGCLFVGFNRGYVKEYSLKDLMVTRIYNPLRFIIEIEKLSTLTKNISIETTLIPGIDGIRYSSDSDLVFVNHKRISSNLYYRVFTLDSTPIYVYDSFGDPQVKLEGFRGNVLSAEILEKRTLYLCLSSENNNLYVWNFTSGSLIGKISCNIIVKDLKVNVFYTKMAVHEFKTNERYKNVEDVLDTDPNKLNVRKIEGDMIFTISSSGEILISILKYENESASLNWSPLKSMNIKYTDEEKQDLRKQIQMNIQSKSMTSIYYDQTKDNLYFTDQEANVTMIKNILKLSFTKS